MMAEALLGKSLEQAAALDQAFRAMMRGEGLDQRFAPELGDLLAMQVVREYPVRIKCALLPGWRWKRVWRAMNQSGADQEGTGRD